MNAGGGTQLVAGLGGMVVGGAAGAGMAWLASDGNERSTNGLEATLLGLGGVTTMMSFPAILAMPHGGARAALGAAGVGAMFTFGMAAAGVTLLHAWERS